MICVVRKKIEYVVVVFFLQKKCFFLMEDLDCVVSVNSCLFFLEVYGLCCVVFFVFEHLQKTAGGLCRSYIHQNQDERLIDIWVGLNKCSFELNKYIALHLYYRIF